MRKLFDALFLCFFITGAALADTVRVPADQPTIQDGIDASVDGDVVLVGPGTYEVASPVVFRGKGITVRSSDGPLATIIRLGDAADPNRRSVVAFEGQETEQTVLEGFTLTGGKGIRTLVEFQLLNKPTIARAGGAIFCDSHAGPRIVGNIIRDNAAEYGSGVFVNVDSRPELIDNRFIDNNTISADRSRLPGAGGLACMGDSVVVVEGGSFSENRAVVGGGIFFAADTDGEVRGVLFEGNSAEFHGGAIFSRGTGLTVSDCVFLDNSSEGLANGTGGAGGAIEVDAFSFVEFIMDDCMFEGNTAQRGGGLAVENILADGSSLAEVSRCSFFSNRAVESGGGVYTEHEAERIELRDCRFERNQAPHGGGLYCAYGGQTEVHGSVFSENYAVFGGGVCCEVSNTAVFNSTIVGNAAGRVGGGIHVINPDSRLTLKNDILWHNAGGSLRGDVCRPGSVCLVTYCAIEDDEVWPGQGNVNSDPKFAAWGDASEVWVDSQKIAEGTGSPVNPFRSLAKGIEGYDLALTASSPCLGSGEGGVDMGADTGVVDTAGSEARTVHLGPGSYAIDDLTLALNISIVGAGIEQTTLEGSVTGLRDGSRLSGVTVSGGLRRGGVVLAEAESPEITRVCVSGNAVILLEPSTDPEADPVENLLLGAGISCYASSPTLTNCTISGNFAGDRGAGLHCRENSGPTLLHCTIAGNRGSGVHAVGHSSPTLINSIVWGNSLAPLRLEGGAAASVSYSCLDGAMAGVGNISSDPLFVEPGSWLAEGTPADLSDDRWVRGDYRLDPLSPCVDVGDPTKSSPTDIEGNERPCLDGVDMGAYESGDCRALARFIRADANGDGKVNLADPSFIANFVFGVGAATPPSCEAAADANGDGAVNIADPTYVANFLFGIGPAAAPPAPFPDCALVPPEEPLSCLGTEGCLD